MTTEVTPNAVNKPPTRTPQMSEKISASPTAISKSRVASRNIVGTRWRQEPCGAPSNTVAFSPDNTSTSTKKPNTVASTRTGANWAGTCATLTNSSSSAVKGTT